MKKIFLIIVAIFLLWLIILSYYQQKIEFNMEDCLKKEMNVKGIEIQTWKKYNDAKTICDEKYREYAKFKSESVLARFPARHILVKVIKWIF